MQSMILSRAQPAWRGLLRPAVALASSVLMALSAGCGGGGDDVAPLASATPGPGALDASFGKANDGTPDGVVNLSLGSGNDAANAVALQADGKMVVAGSSTSTGGSTRNIVVQRFNTDGTPDSSFGPGTAGVGAVSLNLGDNTDDVAKAVAIQLDGKIVVAGTSTGRSSNIVLARLNANGTLDAAFGSGVADGTPDGVVAVNLGDGDDVVNALVIQPNGKLLVAGTTTSTTGGTTGGTTSGNIMVARLNADGTPDTGFGAGVADGTPDGVVSVSLGDGSDEANAIALQADGRIVVAGTTTSTGSSSNIAVVRLNGNGTLDTDFGAGSADGTPDGVVSLSLGDGNEVARGLALQADGKVVVVGNRVNGSSTDIVVLRLLGG